MLEPLAEEVGKDLDPFDLICMDILMPTMSASFVRRHSLRKCRATTLAEHRSSAPMAAPVTVRAKLTSKPGSGLNQASAQAGLLLS